jgi:hypothetical protein
MPLPASQLESGVEQPVRIKFHLLLFKIILAPILIGLVTLAGRRWGPGVSGWLLGFPLNAAPILFFMLLEQGPQFTSRAALGSLMGIIAWATFNLVYAYCCLRMPWWWSTFIGWTVYSLLAWLLTTVNLGLLSTYILVCGTLMAIVVALPKADFPVSSLVHSGSELWLRMASASAMIVALTASARALGPRASGILSSFPALTTILAVFNHHQQPEAAVRVLKGLSASLYTAATFLVVLSASLLRFGAVLSFIFATAAALLVQSVSFFYMRRRW